MTTYVCPSSQNLTTWIEVVHIVLGEKTIVPTPVKFKHGQLVLEDEAEIAAMDALLVHPKCKIGSIVQKLDRDSAEEFARNFRTERAAAVSGTMTSAAMAGQREGAQLNAEAQMLADGLSQAEVDKLSKELATDESLMVTEQVIPPAVSPTPAKIPALLVKP